MPIPDALLQEAKALLALHARDMVLQRKEMKEAGQLLMMEKVFHGSSGYGSVIDAMMELKGFYKHLFIRRELEVNRQGNEFRTSGFMEELNPIIHCQEGATPRWLIVFFLNRASHHNFSFVNRQSIHAF